MSIDTKILSALRTADEGFAPAVELAARLGVTRTALRARVEELRTLGYDIEASPLRGYRLRAAPDKLHADDLLARMGKVKVVGRDIRVFEETTSTSDVVGRLAQDGVKEGVVVFAESQTKGRGRLGRKWTSPAHKGLWFSVLLRPKVSPQAVTQVTITAATALARAIREQTDLKPEIKWPNDILIKGKKVAGILTELHAELDRVRSVILGIGVDVNLTTADFPAELRRLATSLKMEMGKEWPRAELAAGILHELDRNYARLGAGEFEVIADEWADHCTTLDCNVSIRVGPRKIEGRAESLDADGALLVRTEHGHLERVIGGDVTLEK
ncbi:MAG: biotin--[acetyl-CoA-carboxylase] ligase [Verrucomicrobia bacterium]|nr:biotin--[acetyl-CoA-carboxylase] ligase [Verrucomicrobiota bacterium]